MGIQSTDRNVTDIVKLFIIVFNIKILLLFFYDNKLSLFVLGSIYDRAKGKKCETYKL